MAKLIIYGMAIPIMMLLSSAQVIAQAPEKGPKLLEEIVVTARMREETLQDIPLSISAFSRSDLEESGAASMYDISNSVVGFNFEDYAGGGFPAPTIRGLSPPNILAFETNVSFFFGGIYLPKSYMADLGVAGVERIEVLKGPQSALYGRNAFAGVVNYVPLTPPEEFTLDTRVTIGSDERLDYGMTVGGPIIKDSMSILAGFELSEFDGTWENSHPNASFGSGTQGNMGGHDNESYFVTLNYQPTDRLDFLFGYNRWEKENEQQGKHGIRRNNGGSNCSVGSDGVLQFFCGTLPDDGDSIVDPRATGLVATHEIYRAEVSYDFDSPWSLNYKFGHLDSEGYQFDATVVDQINGDVPSLGVKFVVFPIGGIDGSSHDLRLNYEYEATIFSVGAYYQELTDENALWVTFPDAFRDKPALANDSFSDNNLGEGLNIPVTNQNTDVENKSVFAEFARDFSDGDFNLSAEVRYTEEKKTQDDVLADRVDSDTFDFLTPRLTATWNYAAQRNLYVSAAKGEKSGGFNGGGLPSERVFDPESNWTYELGTKNSLLDDRLVLNAAIFYIEWDELQALAQSADPDFIGTITRNIGSATSKGLEAEFTALLTQGLQINGGFSYQDATWDDGQFDPSFLIIRNEAGDFIDACDDIVCPSDGSIGGNSLTRQSKYHAVGGVRYDSEFGLFENGSYWLQANINYKSKQYLDNMNLTEIPSRTLVNLNAGITNGKLSLEGWIRNLLDEEYVSNSLFNLSPPGEIRYTPSFGDKMTFGINLRYRM